MTEINGLIDWFIHWFVDWLNIQMGSHILSVCVQSAGCTMSVRLRGAEGRVRWEAMFGSSRGSERREVTGGRGRDGEVGRLGASVRREESWEVRWRSNYGHPWSVWTQQSPTHWFYSQGKPLKSIQRCLLSEIWLIPNHRDLRARRGYRELQEHSRQNTPTNLRTALVRMWSWMASYLGPTVLFKPKPAWATWLHIAAEEHAKTYINRSSDVAPFCVSDGQVIYVSALRRTVFHKESASWTLTHTHTQAVQAGWRAPGRLPMNSGWESGRKMEGVKRERSGDGIADTHRQTY